jgi:hypothetical protein
MPMVMRLFNLAVVLLAITLTSCYSGALPDSWLTYRQVDLSIGDDVLKFPFKVKDGQIISRIVSHMDPEGRALFLVIGTRTQMIDDLKILQSHVQIETPQGALAFVRLKAFNAFRDMGTVRKPGDPLQLEVMPRKKPQRQPARSPGDKRYSLDDIPDGFEAVISAGTAKRLGLTFAVCVRAGTGFEVTRTLLVCPISKIHYDMERDKQYLERVVEWVGSDGEYRIMKRTKLNIPAGRGSGWDIPSRE